MDRIDWTSIVGGVVLIIVFLWIGWNDQKEQNKERETIQKIYHILAEQEKHK